MTPKKYKRANLTYNLLRHCRGECKNVIFQQYSTVILLERLIILILLVQRIFPNIEASARVTSKVITQAIMMMMMMIAMMRCVHQLQ